MAPLTPPVPLKILVLKGGDSSEREVSLSSARRVVEALASRGHEVTEADPAGDPLAVLPAARAADVVWMALHGGTGEDGTMRCPRPRKNSRNSLRISAAVFMTFSPRPEAFRPRCIERGT